VSVAACGATSAKRGKLRGLPPWLRAARPHPRFTTDEGLMEDAIAVFVEVSRDRPVGE
jgi:hypothetical protein